MVINIANKFFCLVFAALCAPFASLHPLCGLLVLSMVAGGVMLIIFRFTSNQEKIRQTKNRIKAYFLESRLFKGDFGLVLEIQKNIFKHTFFYIKYSIRPVLFLIIPVGLLMIQMSLWFAYAPLKVGESAIIKLKFKKQSPLSDKVALMVPEGIALTAPPVRIQEEREIAWRVKALKNGFYDLTFETSEGIMSKKLVISDYLAGLSVRKVSANFLQQLLYPGEESLPQNSGIAYIAINYHPVAYYLGGWQIHWLVIFFIVSLATGFLLKGFFRVEI